MLKFFGKIVFATRWLLVPLYLGLFVALGAYDIKFFEELVHIVQTFRVASQNALVLAVVDLIDIIMIANLVVMIAIGGYSVFVREYLHEDVEGKQKPRWLNDINSSTQKIKMNVSLIGVSSVHLLHAFVEAKEIDWDTLGKQLGIHAMFLFSVIILCYVNNMLHASTTDHH